MISGHEMGSESGLWDRGSSAVVDNEFNQIGEVVWSAPRFDHVPLVFSDEPEHSCIGENFLHAFCGHPRIGRRGQAGFDFADFGPWKFCGGEVEHFEALVFIGQRLLVLVWRLATRNEDYLVEVELFQRGSGDGGVSEVDRIEGPTEESDPWGSHEEGWLEDLTSFDFYITEEVVL